MDLDELIMCPNCSNIERLEDYDCGGADDGNVFCNKCHLTKHTPKPDSVGIYREGIVTVEELIAELQKLPPTAQVILQKDAEGNGYSPLAEVDGDAIYKADSTWHGEVVSTNWSADDACFESDEEWERYKAEHPRCCVLAPVN